MKQYFYGLLVIIVVILVIVLAVGFIPCQSCEKGHAKSVSVLVEVPVERAWQNLQDYSLAHKYVPHLYKTEIVSEQQRGLGAHRRVYSSPENYNEETIIEWREGEGFLMRLHRGAEVMPPFSVAEFRYAIAAVNSLSTRVTLTMTIQLPLGRVGNFLAGWMAESIVANSLIDVAAGLKLYYETGAAATDEDRAAVRELVSLH